MKMTKRFPLLSTILTFGGLIPAAVMAAALVYPQAASADPAKATLTVTVSNIAEHKGALMIAVYDQAGYDGDKQVAAGMVPVTGDTATTTFELAPGQYGIKMFHDVDGDGKMATNPFGAPIEPFAFSNNAPAQFGPATWAAAKFDVGAAGATQSIKLN